MIANYCAGSMGTLADVTSLLLSSVGLTVLVVWPENGPMASLRERVLRPMLPTAAREVLDCYICMGFWAGLGLSPIWWAFTRSYWCWSACLMVPGLFWILLGNPASPAAESEVTSDE